VIEPREIDLSGSLSRAPGRQLRTRRSTGRGSPRCRPGYRFREAGGRQNAGPLRAETISKCGQMPDGTAAFRQDPRSLCGPPRCRPANWAWAAPQPAGRLANVAGCSACRNPLAGRAEARANIRELGSRGPLARLTLRDQPAVQLGAHPRRCRDQRRAVHPGLAGSVPPRRSHCRDPAYNGRRCRCHPGSAHESQPTSACGRSASAVRCLTSFGWGGEPFF